MGKENWTTNSNLLLRLLIISIMINISIVVFIIGRRIHFLQSQTVIQSRDNKINIVLLGDSRVSGANWAKGLQREDLTNCGISGISTLDVIRIIDTVYKLKPKVCILQVGINDIRNNRNIDSIEINYIQIVDSLLYHKVEPVITSIIPLRKDYWSDLLNETIVNIRTDSLNSRLIRMCKKRHITYIDINKGICENNRLKREYTCDGIHLNENGYNSVYENVKKVLNKKVNF